ncbi:hypothetical protein PTTG_25448 [Puccinia triticina 1-1 BBBD Race 1]|uniref:Uncharacterized protein n=1 Tax=Puccinia triticina (isolate 1-1 / race 1 (BBBD)) TaxID=630390 RepID=A0A180H3I8_PUCT1|nr:hypothetical protein PTTG_25448 [Puccinia triticina 1-1 BBBD Race 1]WAR54636.1 hypothetical protein PtB15_4B253 [Puccinia triticina]
MTNQIKQDSFLQKITLIFQLFLTFVIADLPLEGKNALLDFDRQSGQDHRQLDDLIQSQQWPLPLLNHNAGYTTSPPSYEPQFAQRPFSEAQHGALLDDDWSRWPQLALSAADTPRTNPNPVSQSNKLDHQHFTHGSTMLSYSNTLGLVELARTELRLGNINLDPPTPENLLTTVIPSEPKHWPIQRSSLVGAFEEYDSVSSPTELREGRSNDLSSFKRKRLATTDHPKPKNRKKLSESKLAGSAVVPQTPEISKPSTDGEPINPLDMFSLTLKTYGLINPLAFPRSRKWTPETFFEKDVLHISDFWKNLNGSSEFSKLPSLIRAVLMISRTSSQDTVLQRARALLDEIFCRHGQFLLAFSASTLFRKKGQKPAPDDSEILKLRTSEQEKLLQWLVTLFTVGHAGMDSGDSTVRFGPSEVKEGYTPSSSLYRLFFAYCTAQESDLTTDWLEIREFSRTIEQPIKASLGDAMKTQFAINTVGVYFKSTNPLKWRSLFEVDAQFPNMFAYLQKNQYHRHTARIHKNHLIPWQTMGVLPWEKPPKPWHLDIRTAKNFKLTIREKDNLKSLLDQLVHSNP